MNLVIDIGNSKVKVAVFEIDTMIFSIVCEETSLLDELKKGDIKLAEESYIKAINIMHQHI